MFLGRVFHSKSSPDEKNRGAGFPFHPLTQHLGNMLNYLPISKFNKHLKTNVVLNREQQGLSGKPETRGLCASRTWRESPFAAQIKKPLQKKLQGLLNF